MIGATATEMFENLWAFMRLVAYSTEIPELWRARQVV